MTRYSDCNHGSVVLDQLQSLRLEGLLTDVSLKVNADTFPCHRSVLAACSPYFKAMFTGGMSESRQETVALQDVEPLSLRLLLDFLYTGNIILDDQNVQDVFVTANLLQVVPLIHFCAEYLEKSLSIANCIGMYCLATAYSCVSLLETSWEYINYNFILVSKQEEFLNAPSNVVLSIASSRMLNVRSEGDVFEAMFQWYKKDPTSKVCTAQQILKHVNVKFLSRMQVARARTEGLLPLEPTTSETNPSAISDSQVSASQSSSSEPGARLGMSAQELILMAGRHGRQNTIFCVHLPSRQCYFLDLPPICRTFGALVTVVDNEVYAITNDYQDKSMFHYNHIRKKWMAVAQRLQGRTDFQLQVVNGNIYILGGLNDWEILNSVERYDPSVDEWQFMTPMPRDVIDFTSAVYRDSIYIFSGSRTMSYNTVTDLWTATLPAMTTPRLRSACVTHGKEIWVIGGSSAQSSTEVPCIQVEKYLPDEGRWESGGYLPSLMKFCLATVYQKELYLCAVWCGVHEMGVNVPVQLHPQFDLYLYNKHATTFNDVGIDIPLQDVLSCSTARLFTENTPLVGVSYYCS
ncbi:kelch repeat and BTB domain-containing protein 8-like isoform X1 [Lytechinus pictus]|uniref:kelch repeat and BTB domain-containing protein 8-like isoform X1 n=1 Tax=Lytechinus pictus TaxID=7653 RepID=UPI0030B9F78B